MISNIFGETKPINNIIILAFMFVFYWLVHFVVFNNNFYLEQLFSKTLVLSVLLFSIFVIDFIIKRNKMTGSNSYAMLFYALLMMIFPETMADDNAILCSFFLVLSARRLISIRSLGNIKLKIFDATLWVMISSVFYDWAVLYFLLIFTAIYIYEPKNVRNWLVPLAGIFVFFMITYCVLILANNTEFLVEHYQFKFAFDVTNFLNWGSSSKLIVYLLMTSLAIVYSFLKLGKSGLGKIVTMRLVALSFIIGIFFKIVISSQDAHPIMITFFPAVIFMTNFVEAIKRPNIKEVVLIVAIFVPFMVFLSSIIIR